jgi:hypothetical protein
MALDLITSEVSVVSVASTRKSKPKTLHLAQQPPLPMPHLGQQG